MWSRCRRKRPTGHTLECEGGGEEGHWSGPSDAVPLQLMTKLSQSNSDKYPPRQKEYVNQILNICPPTEEWVEWSSGTILPLGGRGPGFKSSSLACSPRFDPAFAPHNSYQGRISGARPPPRAWLVSVAAARDERRKKGKRVGQGDVDSTCVSRRDTPPHAVNVVDRYELWLNSSLTRVPVSVSMDAVGR